MGRFNVVESLIYPGTSALWIRSIFWLVVFITVFCFGLDWYYSGKCPLFQNQHANNQPRLGPKMRYAMRKEKEFRGGAEKAAREAAAEEAEKENKKES